MCERAEFERQQAGKPDCYRPFAPCSAAQQQETFDRRRETIESGKNRRLGDEAS